MPGSLPSLEPPLSTVRLGLAGGRLEVAGRLHHRTAHLIHDAISALVQAHSRTWVIDVSELTGADSDCWRVLRVAHRRAVRTDCR